MERLLFSCTKMKFKEYIFKNLHQFTFFLLNLEGLSDTNCCWCHIFFSLEDFLGHNWRLSCKDPVFAAGSVLYIYCCWGFPEENLSNCNKLTMCVVRINAGEWKHSLIRIHCSLYWWAGCCCKLLLFSSRRFEFSKDCICMH